MRTSTAISAHNLTRRFGSVTAVDDISLTVPVGQIVALLGANGAGKTTLIDMLLGMTAPTKGKSALFDLTARDAMRRSLVGVVHQSGALPMDYTVKEAVGLFARTHPHHLPVDQILDETKLSALAPRPIRKLSGGECQRVRLALALLPDPYLLILDEPTAGMDATARREFWELMRAQAAEGRTILFATHYLAEAQDFAQRTIILKAGRIIADAPTDELRQRGRTTHMSIAVPEDSGPGLVEELRNANPQWQASYEAGRVHATGKDMDDAARIALAHPGAHDISVTASTLEDVFTELTA
ncbi:ABC transporter ATP-binding protein [Schaalia georgiae]|nr:ABC transporter ATP-binding protein [Schaalia georgiae]